MRIPVLILLCVVSCDKPSTPPSIGSGSAVAVVADAEPIDRAPPLADAAAAQDVPTDAAAAPPVAPVLGAPMALTGRFKGLVVQPVGDWIPKQKSDHVSFTSPCCIQQLLIRPAKQKLNRVDDLTPVIQSVFPVIKEVTKVVEQHDVDRGWWAVITGPSPIFEGDVNTAVIQVAHVAGKTFVCSALLDTKVGPRDIRADELITACGTLRAK